MGKPTSLHSKGSDYSLPANTKDKMNARMRLERRRRRKYGKTNQNIKKLFAQLRNDTQSSIDTDSTVVAFPFHDTNMQSQKRKIMEPDPNIIRAKQRRYSDTNCVVIDHSDNEVTPVKCRSNVQCSTPINKKVSTEVLQDLIVSNFSSTKLNNNTTDAQNNNQEVTDLTREINGDSYLTIDLTNETTISSCNRTTSTVIDLVNQTENDDCTVISVSDANLSISGESDVTVLNISQNKKDKQMEKFVQGIAKLDTSEKDRLLELITQKIFSGCSAPKRIKSRQDAGAMSGKMQSVNKTTDNIQDSYIKEVILGGVKSRNSIGSNIYNPEHDVKNKIGLRMIVIDGSNVAMEHGKGREFSVKGLKICIDYFLKRGHVVKAFVPRFRCKFGKSTDPRLLDDLERSGLVVYTPSREIQGRMITSYDDRYIVQCAAEFDGVIVSGDNYRDLLRENPRWRFVIENRLLPFTWVQDMIMFPKDPLGRNGPTLEQFLKHTNESTISK